jgi:hypothetical protein
MGSELRLYDVTVGANKTRMRLDDRDAKAMGDNAVPVAEAPKPPPPAPPREAKPPRLVTNKMRGTDPGDR